MTTPAAPGVDFDRNRIGQGELIAGIAGLVLLIDLWIKWYGVSKVGGVNVGAAGVNVSGSAWQVFSFIDILLFLCALVAITVAVLRGLGQMPELPWPPALIVAGAGALATLLVLFRLISPPGSLSKGGLSVDVDLSRKF